MVFLHAKPVLESLDRARDSLEHRYEQNLRASDGFAMNGNPQYTHLRFNLLFPPGTVFYGMFGDEHSYSVWS